MPGIDVSGPIELEQGYFEFRANWSAADLMDMKGEQLDRLKGLIKDFEKLSKETTPKMKVKSVPPSGQPEWQHIDEPTPKELAD